mmetsp:Transcript_6408/g.11144  ORF Transcript_6408/g.11144 Transcript_6408/m.11144 type:complete len:165 (-) Transcript_6408:156-650(-)
MADIFELCLCGCGCCLSLCKCMKCDNCCEYQYEGKWTHGFFDCFAKPAICCLALIPGGYCALSGISTGKAKSEGCMPWYLFPMYLACLGGAINRSQIREKFELEGLFFEDFCSHLFCCFCAVCQEYNSVEQLVSDKKQAEKEQMLLSITPQDPAQTANTQRNSE